jgi:Fur family ferric uptake transcriptional regulator
MTETIKKIFTEYLERNNHRKTSERFTILEEVYSTDKHFDIETLYIQMKNKNIRVSRATIYNTMDILTDCKLVIKHQFGNGIAQYEKTYASNTHDHLINIDDGTVTEFFDKRIHRIISNACKENNFELSHHTLYIYGKKIPAGKEENL